MVADPRPDARSGAVEGIAVMVVGVGAIGALIFWFARPSDPRESLRAPFALLSPGRMASGGRYAGDAVCNECHREEFEAHARSGHSRTLHLAAATEAARVLGGTSSKDPEFPGVEWSYANDGDQFHITRRSGATSESYLVDFAFGSGTHATTFLTMTDLDPAHPSGLEHRLTWYAGSKTLDVTPGHESRAPASGVTPSGRTLGSSRALRCFRCHTTATSRTGPEILDVATMIPNIGCERCHGPARDHVLAARAGQLDLKMPSGKGNLDSNGILRACGECHRHPENTPREQIRVDNLEIVRHQPVGLSQSRCYLESKGGLSCVTCHDPHAPASPDIGGYEKVCLSCHSGPDESACSQPSRPADGCVRCHMPRRNSGQGILFSDHWIRRR